LRPGIERREFDRIVPNYLDLEDRYLEVHLGAGSAALRAYQLAGESDGYFIYTPASTDG
jgi:hypothetical protein